MEEHIDIVDQHGIPTGVSVPKSEIHSKGHLHNTAHVWFYSSEGNILLQQRAASKTIYPLLWDVSVAGHIDAGETYIEAALRETEEEIGLQLKPESLSKIGVILHESSYNKGSIQDNEFHHVYISELKVGVNKLIPQEEEVEALKLVSLNEFKALLKQSESNSHFVSSNKSYYEFILNTIKEELNT